MNKITVQASIKASLEDVWKCWNSPEDIVKWNSASSDWHTPHATNDLRTGGKFCYRMEARDGSAGFDFEGVYDSVILNRYIEYSMADGRNVKIAFSEKGDQTEVVETFDPESINPVELQRNGWQAIIDRFKKYIETKLND